MRELNLSEVNKISGAFVVQGLSGSLNALAAGYGYLAAGGSARSAGFSQTLGAAFIAGALSPARTAAALGGLAAGAFIGGGIAGGASSGGGGGGNRSIEESTYTHAE